MERAKRINVSNARLRRLTTAVHTYVLVAAAACQSAPPAESPVVSVASPDRAKVSQSLAQTFVRRSGWEQRFERLLESPRVSEAGERLWQKLENDPQLVQAGNAYLERAFTTPRLGSTLQALGTEHPEWSEEDFARELTARVNAVTEHERYDELFDAPLETPRAGRAIDVWADGFGDSTAFVDAVDALVVDRTWRKTWKRYVGVTTSDEELFERLDAFLMSEEGAELADALGVALLSDPNAEQLLVDLLDHPELFRIVKARLMQLLAAPDFVEAGDECLARIFGGQPMDERLSALEAVLATDAVEQGFAELFLEASKSDALNSLVERAYAQMLRNLVDNHQLATQLASVTI